MDPTILVVFGATGDVVSRKVIPALAHLFEAGKLPEQFCVVGVGRRDLEDGAFQEYVGKIIEEKALLPEAEVCRAFLKLFTYHRVEFETLADYESLKGRLRAQDEAWNICANKLFYLAVPPVLYEPIFHRLADSGLRMICARHGSWTRILVEKPIGSDQVTAERLDRLMSGLFQEDQIYRIEHYLAKEMVRNILIFRFSNTIFEGIWNSAFIERVDIRLWETLGVETRGAFYDQVGALRDVGQNHLLQMLALVAMDHPRSLDPEAIRKNRAAILQTLHYFTPEEASRHTYRAQYVGYQEVAGVGDESRTETFFRIKTWLETSRWKGVPFYLESGKRMAASRKEIEITFRHPEPCFCTPEHHKSNCIVISLEPEERITVDFLSKTPGHGMEMEKRSLEFVYRQREARTQYVEEYEKVLLDAILGDQTLFINTAELHAMWRFVDPILQSWQKELVTLDSYQPDTDQASLEAGRIV